MNSKLIKPISGNLGSVVQTKLQLLLVTLIPYTFISSRSQTTSEQTW